MVSSLAQQSSAPAHQHGHKQGCEQGAECVRLTQATQNMPVSAFLVKLQIQIETILTGNAQIPMCTQIWMELQVWLERTEFNRGVRKITVGSMKPSQEA